MSKKGQSQLREGSSSAARKTTTACLPPMFAATRRWFRRNRTPIAIGVGVVGAGYLVTQYIISKINDARERMSSDRVAKEKCDSSRLNHPSALCRTG